MNNFISHFFEWYGHESSVTTWVTLVQPKIFCNRFHLTIDSPRFTLHLLKLSRSSEFTVFLNIVGNLLVHQNPALWETPWSIKVNLAVPILAHYSPKLFQEHWCILSHIFGHILVHGSLAWARTLLVHYRETLLELHWCLIALHCGNHIKTTFV